MNYMKLLRRLLPQPELLNKRVRLSGGYDADPAWLCGRVECFGRVTRFIPVETGKAATKAVVELESPLPFSDIQATHALLSLRYADAVWSAREIVHIELSDSDPLSPQAHTIWAESHASYSLIG